mmetsp:Transcript_20930/g.61934  ORF Transcript_20930/g.61934 Transcript_20930/m.61934 type:complete len:249 (+) Transcript_20930:392-1138(+)
MRLTTKPSQANLMSGVVETVWSMDPRAMAPSVLDTRGASSSWLMAPSLFLSWRRSTRCAISMRPLAVVAKSWNIFFRPWSSKPFLVPNLETIACGVILDCFLNWSRSARRLAVAKSASEVDVPRRPCSARSMGRSAEFRTESKKTWPKRATKKHAWPVTFSTALPSTTATKKVQKGMSRYPQHMPHMSKAALGQPASRSTPMNPCFSVKSIVQSFSRENTSFDWRAAAISASKSPLFWPARRAALLTR